MTKKYINVIPEEKLLGTEFPAKQVSHETRQNWVGACNQVPAVDGGCWGCDFKSCICTTNSEVMIRYPRIGTIKGRHEMPVDDYVITGKTGKIENPVDVKSIEEEVSKSMKKIKFRFGDKVEIFVTGLTLVTIAVIKAAKNLDMEVTLFHYDRETNSYFPQEV